MAIECAAWPEETGVTSQFIKSHYIPVKGGFNFSGIPIALTYYIPVHIPYSVTRSDNLYSKYLLEQNCYTRYANTVDYFNVNLSTDPFEKHFN